MKKRKKGRKLHRKSGQRRALLKSLSSALILNEKIKTTEAKAKELSGFIEKFITIAKSAQSKNQDKNLASIRLLAKLFSKEIVKKLIEEIAPRYMNRKGGYTKIVKLGQRKNDGAEMAIIELIK
ncbi:50S ribosomal protein L17 [Patescibacteria group bacterium]